MAKCSGCGRFLATTDGVVCPKCKSISHRECVGLRQGATVTALWRCPECKIKTPKQADTPVKGIDDGCTLNPVVELEDSVAAERADHIDLAREIRMFREELRAVRQELFDFKCTLSSITSSINLCDERIDKLEGRVGQLEGRTNDKSDVVALERTVAQLRLELNSRDQELLVNDIEIAGIPEEKGEAVSHIVLTVANKLGITLDERDLVSAERAGPLRAGGAVEGGAPGPARARPIVARLARRAPKEQLLREARVRRGATTGDMGLAGPSRRFYINERLTRFNRQLFYKARELGDQKNWRYIWTRDGSIFARRQDKAERHRLRSEEDLARVFGPARVGLTDAADVLRPEIKQ